jgi:hypothetical protein
VDLTRMQERALLEREPSGPSAAEQAGADQADLVLGFFHTLVQGGLTHEEALWLTAQVWRAG